MLGRKFIIIDGVRLPTPTQGPKITMRNLESVMTSEAGTDLVDVIRLQKKSIAWFIKNMDKEINLFKKKHRVFLVSFWNHPGDDQYTFKMLRISDFF